MNRSAIHLQHVRAQDGLRQAVANVAPGLHELLHHVLQRRLADAELGGGLRQTVGLHALRQIAERPRLHVRERVPREREQPLRRVVALRVDGGVVEHVFALRHAQEARALLEGLRPELRHLLQLAARGKGAVFLAVRNDILRRRRGQTGNAPQQGGRRRVQIHAHCVHAVLHHVVQRGFQLLLRHVVLILPDADGLRLDLHKLRQRVLQPPRDRNRRAQVHVKLRKLLRCERARGIDRGARL